MCTVEGILGACSEEFHSSNPLPFALRGLHGILNHCALTTTVIQGNREHPRNWYGRVLRDRDTV